MYIVNVVNNILNKEIQNENDCLMMMIMLMIMMMKNGKI